jgi:hypothetical protein
MSTPAIDYEGSGALQYLRAEAAELRQIHFLLPPWSPYVALSNSVSLSYTITISRREAEFEARRNLQAIRESFHLGTGQLSSTDLAVAEAALIRLRARQNENAKSWAVGLSTDLSSHRD